MPPGQLTRNLTLPFDEIYDLSGRRLRLGGSLSRSLRLGCYCSGQFLVIGEEELEHRTCALAAPHMHNPVVFQNDFVAHPEPQTRTRGAFGREESLKKTVLNFRVHSTSSIGDRDSHSVALGMNPVL